MHERFIAESTKQVERNSGSASSLREVGSFIARTRRDFLRDAAGVAMGSTLLRPRGLAPQPYLQKEKS